MPTKSFHRTDRVSAQLRRELGTLVHVAVREHGLPSVSVSDVEVTRDLAHAKVFVTALMPERSTEAVKAFVVTIESSVDARKRFLGACHPALDFLKVELHFGDVAVHALEKLVHQFVGNVRHSALRRNLR